MSEPLEDGLDEHLADLANHTAPDGATMARLRSRLRPARTHSEPRKPLPWWAHVASLTLAAAAAVFVLSYLPSIQPGTEQPLQAWVPTPLQAARHVELLYQGEGFLRTGRGGTDIRWDLGRLEVEVEPNQGVSLVVGTAEATVHVVGTHFIVDRGPLGTEVTVDRGTVELACRGADPGLLEDGVRLCPRPAVELHAHAVQLSLKGDAPTQVLRSVDLALDGQEAGVLLYELLALRASALSDLGRTGELRVTLKRYLQGGTGLRQQEFEAWLQRLEATDEGVRE